MDNFIYINKNSLSGEVCCEIIRKFNQSVLKKQGITSNGENLNIKQTFDLQIQYAHDEWKDIYMLLSRELNYNVKQYVKNISKKIGNDYKIIGNNSLTNSTFQMQKYIKNTGDFKYHHDFCVENESHRVITFIWYINTVDEGGETEIMKDIRIKPEEGKLLLFPACWTYPHCGLVPKSDHKYIITGWLYAHN